MDERRDALLTAARIIDAERHRCRDRGSAGGNSGKDRGASRCSNVIPGRCGAHSRSAISTWRRLRRLKAYRDEADGSQRGTKPRRASRSTTKAAGLPPTIGSGT
jgi:hypothetical protein